MLPYTQRRWLFSGCRKRLAAVPPVPGWKPSGSIAWVRGVFKATLACWPVEAPTARHPAFAPSPTVEAHIASPCPLPGPAMGILASVGPFGRPPGIEGGGSPSAHASQSRTVCLGKKIKSVDPSMSHIDHPYSWVGYQS